MLEVHPQHALGVLFNPETAVSCETMKIQEWDAALYKTKEHCYLCWTYSPEVSYVLEYNPEAVSDDEIIMMAESAEPYEEKYLVSGRQVHKGVAGAASAGEA